MITKFTSVHDFMILSMKEYFRTNNIHSAVLGISGGIDSTLVAVILNHVSNEFKKEGYDFTFYGISLPTNTTPSEEYKSSINVCNAFCDNFYVVNLSEISEQVSSWLKITDIELNKNFDSIRSGNSKARLRMLYLYDFAKKVNGIVIGTDNYTEYLLGFSTIGGDALFDYNPIQELWKTEVFTMSNELYLYYIEKNEKEKAEAILESLKLKPMDGLGISNDDMEQIGARHYYDVDDILCWYLNNKESEIPDYILSSTDGFQIKKEVIKKIINRHKNSEFKRNHPVTLKRKQFI